MTLSFRARDSPRASLFLAWGSQPLPVGDRFNNPTLSLWRLVLQERSFTPKLLLIQTLIKSKEFFGARFFSLFPTSAKNIRALKHGSVSLLLPRFGGG